MNEVLDEPGSPLDEGSRRFMEPRLGYDLGSVRIHTDTRAADSAAAIGAKAYTVGPHMVFANGNYAPHSGEGRRLMAHELAHTLQQSAGVRTLQCSPEASPIAPPYDAEIANTWSAALRSKPERDANVLVDLPKGQAIVVLGGRGWLHVRTKVGERGVEGYVSHELTKVSAQTLDTEVQKIGGPITKDILRLDQTFKIKGLPTAQANYVDFAIERIASAPLGYDITLSPRAGSGASTPIAILKGDFFIDDDPLKGFTIAQNQVYPTKAVADAVLADLHAQAPDLLNYTYYLRDGIILPTTLSQTTIPNLLPFIRDKRDQDFKDLKATADLAEAVLWWYVGARFPIRIGPGSAASRTATAGSTAGAAKVAFNAAKVADELVSTTASITNNGQRMLAAGRQLSAMAGLSAAEKVGAMLEFFKRIGFAISKSGVVDDTARLIMYSEDGRYAFAFWKNTGAISYGKFDMATMEFIWSAL